MDLKDAWIAYCAAALGDQLPSSVEVLEPWTALDLLFDFMPMFSARADAIRATPYDTCFDAEADGALASLAISDCFAPWEELSAGAWRVMNERLVYAMAVCAANAAAGEPIMAHLPSGLDRHGQARALLLLFLLGLAKTIDRRLLPEPPDGSLPVFPAATKLRRQ